MKIPFNSHTIYITYSDSKIYKLMKDYSLVEVPYIKKSTVDNPSLTLHKYQFDTAKDFLLNRDNPFKLDEESAYIFHRIGFIRSEEYNKGVFAQPLEKAHFKTIKKYNP